MPDSTATAPAGAAMPSVSPAADPPKALTPAAERALAEAAERRQALATATRPRELDGRGGEDPVRFGDWEIKGLAVDF